MRTVTPTYKQIIASGNTRQFHVKIEMTLADETELTLTDANIMTGSFKYETASSGNSSFDIGSAIIGMCKFSMWNYDDEYTLYDFFNATAVVWVKLEGDSEWIRLGLFTVDEPDYAGAMVSLELLDNMWKFDVPLSDANVHFSSTSTCFDLISEICSYCDVILATPRFHGYDFVISEAPEDDMNCREFLQYVAMIGCNFCIIDSQGQLRLKWYDTSTSPSDDLDGGTFSTTTTPYSDGDEADGGNFTYYGRSNNYDGGTFVGDVNVAYLTRNYSATIGTDLITITGVSIIVGETEHTVGTRKYMLSLENPLVNESNVSDVLNLIWDVLQGMSFRTFNVSSLPDISAEVGDRCSIKNIKGHSVLSFITSISFGLSSETVQCNAVSPTKTLTKRYSKAVQSAIVESRKVIDDSISDYDLVVQMMNALAVNAMGAYQSYEDVPTGGRIYYLSNKPITSDEQGIKFVAGSVVFKITGEGFFVSQSAGLRPSTTTFVNGYNAQTGELLINVLDAIGINAEWIKAGSIDADLITTGKIQDRGGINYWDLDNNEVKLSASTTVGGKTVEAIAQEKATAAETAAEASAKNYTDSVKRALDGDIEDLQDQIDGNITTWYYSGVPTLSNLPASQWTTTTDKDNHIGDIYYDSATGYAYRFMKDGNNYVWTKISDSDIEAALSEAQDAWDLADNKRRVFITQPVPPYDIGDLWVQGSGGDIKRCATAKTSSQTYSSSDWVLASKYTDDTAVTNLNNALNQEGIYNRLTNNSETEGIFLSNGHLYLNASMINTGVMSANYIRGGSLIVGGIDNVAGQLYVVGDATVYNSGSISAGSDTGVSYWNDGSYIIIDISSSQTEGAIGRYCIDSGQGQQTPWVELYNGHNVVGFVDGTAITFDIEAYYNLSYSILTHSVVTVFNKFGMDASYARITGGYLGGLSISNNEIYKIGDKYYKKQSSYVVNKNKVTRRTIFTFVPKELYVSESTFKIEVYINSRSTTTSTSRSLTYLLQSWTGSTWYTVETINALYGIGGYIFNTEFSNTDSTKYRIRMEVGSDNFRDILTYSVFSNDIKVVSLSTKGIYGDVYGSLHGSGDFPSASIGAFSIDNDGISGFNDKSDTLGNASSIDLDFYGLTIDRDDTNRVSAYASSSTANIDRTYNGTVYHPSWTTSDERVKENIEELDPSLSKKLIEATETHKFKYKGADGTHYGMIAQEARKLLDSLGEEDSKLEHSMEISEKNAVIDDQRTIDYHEYIPHLINYVKDLRNELNQVKAELRSLKGE